VVAEVDSAPEAVAVATVAVAVEEVGLRDQTSLLSVVAVVVEAMEGAVVAMEVGMEDTREEKKGNL
jgi:hypothetical protein